MARLKKKRDKRLSMRARDLMEVPAITVADKITIDEAASLMWERNVGSVMIVDGTGRMIGIFTERDMLFAVSKSLVGRGIPITSVMSRNAVIASPNESIITSIEKMRETGVRHLPVVDRKSGKPVGMISTRDALEVGGPVMEFLFKTARRKRKRAS